MPQSLGYLRVGIRLLEVVFTLKEEIDVGTQFISSVKHSELTVFADPRDQPWFKTGRGMQSLGTNPTNRDILQRTTTKGDITMVPHQRPCPRTLDSLLW